MPQRSDFEPEGVRGFDGKHPQAVDVAIKGHLRLQNHFVRNVYFIPIDSGIDLIVGRKFFAQHDILIDCRRRRLLFPPEWAPDYYDTDICLDEFGSALKDPAFQEDVRLKEKAMEKDDLKNREERIVNYKKRQERLKGLEAAVRDRINELDDDHPQQRIQQSPVLKKKVRFAPTLLLPRSSNVRGESFEAKMERQLQELPPSPRTIEEKPMSRQEKAEEPEVLRDQHGVYKLRRDSVSWYKDYGMDLAVIGAAPFMMLARRERHGVTSVYELDRIIDDKKRQLQRDEEDLMIKVHEKVPEQYHGYSNVFSKMASDELPANRPGVDHQIEISGRPEDLGYSALYRMSLEEAKACRQYIVDNLRKGFIKSSNTPWAAPVLFVIKPGGRGLRFCVDYRKINAITRKDRYPLPLIDETMTRISQAKFFTKIDIRQAFHRIRMDPAAEELTTFRTRYGAYKYKVLPFGLTNGPSTFQRYINDTLIGYLDDFCSAYVDDVLIFSETKAEHELHVTKVLERLRTAGLQADIDKCEFHVQKTKFLGFIIRTDGVTVDPAKINAVKD